MKNRTSRDVSRLACPPAESVRTDLFCVAPSSSAAGRSSELFLFEPCQWADNSWSSQRGGWGGEREDVWDTSRSRRGSSGGAMNDEGARRGGDIENVEVNKGGEERRGGRNERRVEEGRF